MVACEEKFADVLFSLIDRDKDGTISKEELMNKYKTAFLEASSQFESMRAFVSLASSAKGEVQMPAPVSIASMPACGRTSGATSRIASRVSSPFTTPNALSMRNLQLELEGARGLSIANSKEVPLVTGTIAKPHNSAALASQKNFQNTVEDVIFDHFDNKPRRFSEENESPLLCAATRGKFSFSDEEPDRDVNTGEWIISTENDDFQVPLDFTEQEEIVKLRSVCSTESIMNLGSPFYESSEAFPEL